MSVRWAHRPFCLFCHEVAQLLLKLQSLNGVGNSLCHVDILKGTTK